MAVLGSTVDPRLGAVNPAAIQALSQAGAASGQMYANIGGSIAGVIQDFKSRRDDSALQEALAAHGSFDEKTGTLKVDRKAFLAAAKDSKVSPKLANAYLKNELQISSMQNDIYTQNKMTKYEGQRVGFEKARVGIAEDAQELAGEIFAFEREFKEGDQRLRISQWASDNLMDMQKLNVMREANTIDQEKYEKDYKLATRRYKGELKKLKQSEDLTKAQVKALKAETVLKKSEAALVDAEALAFSDKDLGLESEETINNKLVSSLGIDDRTTQWDTLDSRAKADFIMDRIEGARGQGMNMNSERMKDLQRSYDFFNEDSALKGIYPTQQQRPAPETGSQRLERLKKEALQSSIF